MKDVKDILQTVRFERDKDFPHLCASNPKVINHNHINSEFIEDMNALIEKHQEDKGQWKDYNPETHEAFQWIQYEFEQCKNLVGTIDYKDKLKTKLASLANYCMKAYSSLE